MNRPLAIDLFTGLHGWAEGLVAEGFEVIGFDLEDMCAQFGQPRPEHVRLVVQDVLTLRGSLFKGAALIVASPPCQEYSYMAMPWTKAKAKAAAYRSGELDVKNLTALFDACFRIQREACEAAGRHIPLVVENVRGAQTWVGQARWNYGSFYLWGDVPALMPAAKAFKSSGMNWSDRTKRGQDFTRVAGKQALLRKDGKPHAHQLTSPEEGTKHIGSGAVWFDTGIAGLPSKSKARKQASARIAKIPLALSTHIARTYYPSVTP